MRYDGERPGSQSASTIATAVKCDGPPECDAKTGCNAAKACRSVLGDGALEYHREHGNTERAADLTGRPGDDAGVRYNPSGQARCSRWP
jgi:hypothetical protein